MRLYFSVFLIVMTLASPRLLAAETTTATGSDSATDPTTPKEEPNRELLGEVALSTKPEVTAWRFAAGISSVWSVRRDYGARSFKRFEPEIVGFAYTALPNPRIWLRHGARLGYSSDQPQMPQAARLEETDVKIAVEESLVWNQIVTPTLTAGLGYDWREIQAKRQNPVLSSDSRLNTKDGFMWYYAQAGLGIPALEGEYLLEPLFRFQHLPMDQRTKWAFGFEITRAW